LLTAIPGLRANHYKDFYLADGAISSNTPVRVRSQRGESLIVLRRIRRRHACAAIGAVANVLHALTLLISRHLVAELEGLDPVSNILWCPHMPVVGSPMISRGPPITSSAVSRARTPGWRKTAWSTAEFLRDAPHITEPAAAPLI